MTYSVIGYGVVGLHICGAWERLVSVAMNVHMINTKVLVYRWMCSRCGLRSTASTGQLVVFAVGAVYASVEMFAYRKVNVKYEGLGQQEYM